jgi:LuxR family maltose regulon positive regulatory protein
MARPLIATKLFVPKVRSRLLTRSRLLERLRGGAESRLTLVSAAAGFGKTTLLAQWLATEQSDSQVAWVSLEATDREPSSFWTYVVSALQAAVPGVGSSAALELLASSAVPAETVLTAVVNGLASAPGTVRLILDDYHLVDSQEVAEGLAFLLEHLPPHVHVIISTRADPALPLSRWRARGELVEVRAAELRFTAEEAAAYCPRWTWRPWSSARKGGSPHCSWQLSRSRGAETLRVLLPVSPGTTGTSWTTWSKRCWSINPRRSATSCCTQRFWTVSPDPCAMR